MGTYFKDDGVKGSAPRRGGSLGENLGVAECRHCGVVERIEGGWEQKGGRKVKKSLLAQLRRQPAVLTTAILLLAATSD
jgi:hypothetical protein